MNTFRENVLLHRVLIWGSFVLGWEVLARLVGGPYFPRPSDTAVQLVAVLTNGDLVKLLGSLRQMLVGFAVAAITGIPLGLLIGASRRVESALWMYVKALFIIPTEALLPLLIVLFGTQFTFRAAVVFLFSFFYIVIHAEAAVHATSPALKEMAHAFGASRYAVLRHIVFPSALPYLFSGLQLGLGNAIKGMIIAELWVVVDTGRLLIDLSADQRWTEYLALALYIIMFGALGTGLLQFLQNRLPHGKEARDRDSWQAALRSQRRWNPIGVLSLAIFVGLWQWYGSRLDVFAVAPPSLTFPKLWEVLVSGELLRAAANTGMALAIGYIIAAIVGIGLGLLIALSPLARNTLEPVFNGIQAAPASLFIPAVAVFIGVGIEGRIFIIILWSIFTILFNTLSGMRETPIELHEMAHAFCSDRWHRFWQITVPSALPRIALGLRIGLGRAFRGAIAAETLLATAALGRFIKNASATFQMPRLMAGIVFIIVVGVLLMNIAESIERRIG